MNNINSMVLHIPGINEQQWSAISQGSISDTKQENVSDVFSPTSIWSLCVLYFLFRKRTRMTKTRKKKTTVLLILAQRLATRMTRKMITALRMLQQSQRKTFQVTKYYQPHQFYLLFELVVDHPPLRRTLLDPGRIIPKS